MVALVIASSCHPHPCTARKRQSVQPGSIPRLRVRGVCELPAAYSVRDTAATVAHGQHGVPWFCPDCEMPSAFVIILGWRRNPVRSRERGRSCWHRQAMPRRCVWHCSGADAVYFGLQEGFNARAGNFGLAGQL